MGYTTQMDAARKGCLLYTSVCKKGLQHRKVVFADLVFSDVSNINDRFVRQQKHGVHDFLLLLRKLDVAGKIPLFQLVQNQLAGLCFHLKLFIPGFLEFERFIKPFLHGFHIRKNQLVIDRRHIAQRIDAARCV